MTNSYGVNEVPDDAIYGVYDTENGEWIGTWFFDEESAKECASNLDDENLGVVSVGEDDNCQ